MVDESDKLDREGNLYVNVKESSGRFTRVVIGEQKSKLTKSELYSLLGGINRIISQWDIEDNPIDPTNRIGTADIGLDFDEGVMFESLKEIDGVGEMTAIKILQELVKRTFDDISKDDLSNITGVGDETAEAVWMYLRGYYDASIE